jgi:hypothetical protein
MANNDTLTPAQMRAIAALLTERDMRSAAKVAHVSERRLWAWLKEADFKAEVNRATGAAVEAAVRQLSNLASKAVATLAAVMGDDDSSAGVKVQAANIALARLLDLRQFVELEGRLSTIEAALKVGATDERKAN